MAIMCTYSLVICCEGSAVKQSLLEFSCLVFLLILSGIALSEILFSPVRICNIIAIIYSCWLEQADWPQVHFSLL